MHVTGLIRAVARYTLTGAVIGGVAGWFMFGGTRYNAATGNYGWGPIMAPTFVLIGAVLGLLDLVLVTSWRAVSRRIVAAADSRRNQSTGAEGAEWHNPSNWTVGVFYKSRVDHRIFVPQKFSGGWFTINLGQPIGVGIAVVLVAVLVITIFSMFSR